MPIAPYDTLDTILNTTRAWINDAIIAIGGEVLTDAQPFTQTFANASWRRFQDFLVDLGFARLKQEVVFTGVPAVTTTDTGAQAYISWSEYFDGTSPQANPVLPQDFISPLDLWERVDGTNGIYVPLDQCLNGIPAVPKTATNKLWEWREETLYLPGATSITDLRMRYAAYLPDFETGSVPWYQQPVPIMRCLEPFAAYIAADFCRSRGDLDATVFEQIAEKGAIQIFNRDPAQGKSIFKRSEYGKQADKYSPAMTKGYPGAPRVPNGDAA